MANKLRPNTFREKWFLVGSYFSQQLELIGIPSKRRRGISFKINARICSLDEECGNPLEKSFLPRFQGSMHKTQAHFRIEAIMWSVEGRDIRITWKGMNFVFSFKTKPLVRLIESSYPSRTFLTLSLLDENHCSRYRCYSKKHILEKSHIASL